MKRILTAVLGCLIAWAPAAQTSDSQGPRIMKTLVVYYSPTGKTEAVALALAKELGADVRRVEEVEKPSVNWWFMVTGGFAAIRGVASDIKPSTTEPTGPSSASQ